MIQKTSSSVSEEQHQACDRQLEECRKSICRMQGGEDLYQEVCLRCVKRAAHRNWDEPQYGFIHQVARRAKIDMHRRNAHRGPVSAQSDLKKFEVDGDTQDPVGTGILKQEKLALVRERLEGLPKRYEGPLAEHFLEGKSVQTIANNRHLPLDTVKTRIRRGLERLRIDPVLRRYFADGD